MIYTPEMLEQIDLFTTVNREKSMTLKECLAMKAKMMKEEMKDMKNKKEKPEGRKYPWRENE